MDCLHALEGIGPLLSLFQDFHNNKWVVIPDNKIRHTKDLFKGSKDIMDDGQLDLTEYVDAINNMFKEN